MINNIVYESKSGKYYIVENKTGFEIYKNGVTHSTRCAIIGFTGSNGLNKAIKEIERREA